MRNVIQSFKKVINIAPASQSAATDIFFLASTGTDSVAAGQTSATDSAVPTGSVIKYIEFQFSAVNLVSVAAFMHFEIARFHDGQSLPSPNAVGGSKLRNQILHQAMKVLGPDQNNNYTFRFKVPKKFQRVREGDKWYLVTNCDQIHTSACQIIYKFYR